MQKFKLFDFNSYMLKHKVISLIALILGICIGVCAIIAPFITGGILIWVMIGLLGIGSIYEIIKFICPGKNGVRQSGPFVVSILLLLLVVALILCGAFGPNIIVDGQQYTQFQAMSVRMLQFFGIFFGFMIVFESIFTLCNLSGVPQKGWVIAASIISIIVGILAIIFPFFFQAVSLIIAGIYLVVAGICGIVLLCKNWHKEVKE